MNKVVKKKIETKNKIKRLFLIHFFFLFYKFSNDFYVRIKFYRPGYDNELHLRPG